MRHFYHERLLPKLLFVVCALALFRPAGALAQESSLPRAPTTLSLSLPEASQDVLVSTHMKDWEFSVSGNRFTLRTPVIRSDFSRAHADAIGKVLVAFQPAGGVLSQISRIHDEAGRWMLQVEGTLSRGTTEGIALRSVEVIYRDNSAELIPLGEELALGVMSARSGEDTTGGCNGWFGLAALSLVGLLVKPRA